MEDVFRAALAAGLKPIVARVAQVVAEVEGETRGMRFVREVLEEDARRAGRAEAAAPTTAETIASIGETARTLTEPSAPTQRLPRL